MNFGFVLGLLSVGLLTGVADADTQLNCEFSTWGTTLWPSSKRCLVKNANLGNKNQKFLFAGSTSEKHETSIVHFYPCSGVVTHVPLEIFIQFPNINGLMIWWSHIPILTDEMFADSNFQKIQYLYFGADKIESIQENAFKQMVNLKWIRLDNNKITSIDSDIFKTNPNLEYIDLHYGNQIKSVHHDLLMNLKQLKYIQFDGGNVCFNSNIGCETCSITSQELSNKFQTCYANYQKSSKYIEEVKQRAEDEKKSIELKREIEINERVKNATLKLEAKFNEEIKEKDNKVDELEKKAATANREIETLKQTSEKQKLQAEAKNEKIIEELNKAKSENKLLKQQLANQKLEIESKEAENTKLEKEAAETKKESNKKISELGEETAQLKEELKKCKLEVNEVKERDIIKEMKEMIQQNQQQIRQELEQQNKECKEEINQLKDEDKKLKEETNKCNEKVNKLEVHSLATMKLLLIGINYNDQEGKEIKADIEKIPQGSINMKTYEEAIKVNFAEREEGMEKKFTNFLEKIIQQVEEEEEGEEDEDVVKPRMN